MAELDITGLLQFVDFNPNNVEAEIVQNIRTILATQKGTVPLDRNFGMDWSFVDRPIPVAQASISSQVVQQINRYEPRARVTQVRFSEKSNTIDGQLIPIVSIEVI